MTGTDETIVVRAILQDELSEPADRIDRSLANLREGMDETARHTDSLTESERRNEQQSDRSNRLIRAQTQLRDEHGRFIRRNTEDTDRDTESTRRNTRERNTSTKSIGGFMRAFSKLGKLARTFSGPLKMMGKFTALAVGIGPVGTAAAIAANGLGTLSGAALALPGVILGAAQAVGVAKIAFKGLGSAAGALASGDYAAFAKATEDMPSSMRDAAKAMGELGQQWKPIVKDIQSKVWQGMGTQIEAVGSKILPMVRKSFLSTAEAINMSLKGMALYLTSGQGLKSVGKIMDANAKISWSFANIARKGFAALITTIGAASPAAVKLSDAMDVGMTKLGLAILRNQDGIAAFADKGVDSLLQFGRIVGNFGIGFYNIIKAATGLATGFGDAVEGVSKRFREWTGSAEGQAKIKETFQSMLPMLKAIGGLIAALGTAFMELGGNEAIVDMVNKLTETIPKVVEFIGEASGRLIPALLDIATALMDVVMASNALDVMAIILAGAGIAAEALATVFLALPAPIQTVIGTVVGLTLAMRALGTTAAWAWFAQTTLGAKVILMAKTYWAVLKFITTEYIKQAAAAAWGKIVAGWAAIKVAALAAAAAIKTAAMSMMTFLFTTPIGWVILAVVALVAIFVVLYKKCEGFRNVVNAIGRWFVNVWNNQIFPIVMKVWEWIKAAWDKAFAVVKGVVLAIVNWFRSNWDTIKAVVVTLGAVIAAVFFGIKTVVMTAFNIIKSVIMGVIAVIKPIVAFLAPVFVAAFGLIVNVVKLAWTIIIGVIRIAWAIIKTIVMAAILVIMVIIKVLVVVFVAVWSVIKAVALATWNFLKMAWTSIWNVVKAVFSAIWNGIMAAIQFLTPIVQGVMAFVSSIFMTAWNFVKMIVMGAITFIGGIINSILTFISPVTNAIQSGFSTAWNFVSGLVSSVVSTISGVIGTLLGRVMSVTGGIRDAFASAFNAVSSVVGGVINTIRGWIDSILAKINSMRDGIRSAMDAVNPFNFAGGPIAAGTKSYVGELGPEAFVTHTGKVEMIGQNGMELRQFNKPGYIVPNHVLGGVPDSSVPRGVMDKLIRSVTPNGPTMGTHNNAQGRTRLSQDTYMQDTGKLAGNNYTININGGSGGEIRAAVVAAIRDVERSRKERG